MQKFQQLIYQAFSRIDASDAKMRQRVYENIWLMQEKSLAAQNAAEEQKQDKRHQLTQLLKTVEMQYRAAARPAQPAPDKTAAVKAQPRQPEAAPPAAYADRPPLQAQPAQQRQEQAYQDAFAGISPLKADRNGDSSLYYLEQEVNRKVTEADEKAPSFFKRAKLGAYFIGILSALIAVFVAWSFYNSFGAPGISRKQQALSTAPMQQNNYGKNGWVEVFNPANVTGLAAQGTASADLHNEPDANFIRITAHNADDAAIIEIGQGALMPLRGKTATFKLVARNSNNAIGQLNLTADFGDGTRAHYRFELSPTAAPLLFRLAIPQKLSRPVKFYIGGDNTGKQYQADIFSLLVRESDQAGH